MGRSLFTAKQFVDAIPGTGGIIDTIAKRVGCDWQRAGDVEQLSRLKDG